MSLLERVALRLRFSQGGGIRCLFCSSNRGYRGVLSLGGLGL